MMIDWFGMKAKEKILRYEEQIDRLNAAVDERERQIEAYRKEIAYTLLAQTETIDGLSAMVKENEKTIAEQKKYIKTLHEAINASEKARRSIYDKYMDLKSLSEKYKEGEQG